MNVICYLNCHVIMAILIRILHLCVMQLAVLMNVC